MGFSSTQKFPPLRGDISVNGQSMDNITTEHSFNSQATWVIDVIGLFFDMISMGVWTTRHWRMFGQLVQELDICTGVEYGATSPSGLAGSKVNVGAWVLTSGCHLDA